VNFVNALQVHLVLLVLILVGVILLLFGVDLST